MMRMMVSRSGTTRALGVENYVQICVDRPRCTTPHACVSAVSIQLPAHSCDLRIGVVKRQFGYQKVRFKGLAKNTAQILTLFALSNLWMVRRILLASAGDVRP